MAHESLGGVYVKQIDGESLGIYQMSKSIYDQLWRTYLSAHPSIARSILNTCRYTQLPPAEHMIFNLYLATMMCRVYYRAINKPLPANDDLNAIYSYYKQYYNTIEGAADKGDFLLNYGKFTGKKIPGEVINEEVVKKRKS